EAAADDAGEEQHRWRLDPGGPLLVKASRLEAVGLDGVVCPADEREQVLALSDEARSVQRGNERRRVFGPAGRRKPRELAVDPRAVGADARDGRTQRII